MSSTLEWVGLVSGPSGLAFWGKGWMDRRKRKSETTKVDADAAEVFTKIAVGLVSPLEARVTKLEKENKDQLEYIRTLLSWIRVEVPHKAPPTPSFHIDF